MRVCVCVWRECGVVCPVGTATYGMWWWMNGKTVFNNWITIYWKKGNKKYNTFSDYPQY